MIRYADTPQYIGATGSWMTMAGKLNRSRRLVLQPRVGEEAVEEFAARLGLPRGADTPADEESWTPRQVMWHGDSGVVITYREDLASDLPYVIVMAEDAAELREFTELAEIVLNTWRIPDLLHAVDSADEPEAHADALLRMGLGAPREFDEEFFRRVRDGLCTGHEDVVELALIAITYEPWSEYIAPVRQLLESGVGEEVEET